MTQNNNPPAFPSATDLHIHNHGMTLRDWFAGQSLAGMYANPIFDGAPYAEQAKVAYRMADAMLAERMKEADRA